MDMLANPVNPGSARGFHVLNVPPGITLMRRIRHAVAHSSISETPYSRTLSSINPAIGPNRCCNISFRAVYPI
jgi:hypothetical protein